MLNIRQYLSEARNASEEKLTHLEHAEDHPINAGAVGFEHAKNTLDAVHSALKGEKSKASITTKYDGSPSIVFGHHPETGKFFVASKSAFNKNPKINYTADDIEKNHGHAPGLVNKLKAALRHLPKVAPKTGVFQGDIMHSGGKGKGNPEGDVVTQDGKAHFTPNTITYSTKDKEETDRAAGSKLGVAIHTRYDGPSFDRMKATYNAGHKGFGEHKDVHLMDVHPDKPTIDPKLSSEYEKHMGEAEKLHKQLVRTNGYNALADHTDHLKTYINKTVRTGEKPSVKGYAAHVAEIHQKAADKYKTAAKKQEVESKHQELQNHISANQHHFEAALQLHHHLQAAKDQLVHALSAKSQYGHHIGGQAVKPEGHVAVINNRPTKLVDRAEFSRANFAKSQQ